MAPIKAIFLTRSNFSFKTKLFKRMIGDTIHVASDQTICSIKVQNIIFNIISINVQTLFSFPGKKNEFNVLFRVKI